MALHITEENYEELVKAGKPMMIDFWATWCGPCKRMAPLVEELAEQYADKMNIGKCDIEEAEDLATQFQITSIPTIVFLDAEGNVKVRLVGSQPKSKLEETIQSLL